MTNTTATKSSSAMRSLDALRANPDWAKLPLFDRKGWKQVRFGDVVENLNETEREPCGVGIKRVIAMEHLEFNPHMPPSLDRNSLCSIKPRHHMSLAHPVGYCTN